jgi:16S rRNA (uracil1498-N3)-methyltransferase
MHRFFAPPTNFDDKSVTLGQDETRHLRDVLRMRGGENVHVFDGTGREFLCEVTHIGRRDSVARIVNEVTPAAPESPLELTVAAAILKGDKFDWVVQKAVELGVSQLIPVITARCDVKLKDSTKRVERWRKIVLEASKQCGRAKLMGVGEPSGFRESIESTTGEADSAALLFSERDGVSLSRVSPAKFVTAFTGPEGGWEDSELAAATERGVRIVTFGGRILRAETAAITVSALLQNKFGDMN